MDEDEAKSTADEKAKPPLCAWCQARLPTTKVGRPRKYCSDSCRQHAYEERNGLPHFTNDRAIRRVEADLNRKARRYDRQLRVVGPSSPEDIAAVEAQGQVVVHRPGFGCVNSVLDSPPLLRAVTDRIAVRLATGKFLDTENDRLTLQATADLTMAALRAMNPDRNDPEQAVHIDWLSTVDVVLVPNPPRKGGDSGHGEPA